jgi:Transcriptional regulator
MAEETIARALAQISLTQLRHFLAVAEQLHFGRAAAQLGLSQPPLSKSIALLEQRLQLQLFQRDKRNVVLTPAGRVLQREAQSLLDHTIRLQSVMKGVSEGKRGDVFLGTVPFALFGVVPSLVRTFRKSHPDVSVTLSEGHTGAVIAGVREGKFDFGVAWSSVRSKGLATHTLAKGGFIAALAEGDPLLASSSVTMAELAERAMILPSRKQSPHHHDIILAEFDAAGHSPHIAFEVPSIMSQLGYVASGLGVAIVPYSAVDIPNVGVQFRPILNFQRECHLTLIWSDRMMSEASRQFLDMVRAYTQAVTK